jgi:hypothetical protein
MANIGAIVSPSSRVFSIFCEAVRSAFGVKVWIASFDLSGWQSVQDRCGFFHYAGLASYGFSRNLEAGEMSFLVGVEASTASRELSLPSPRL